MRKNQKKPKSKKAIPKAKQNKKSSQKAKLKSEQHLARVSRLKAHV